MPRQLRGEARRRSKDGRAKGRTYATRGRHRLLDAVTPALTPTILLTVIVLASLALLGVAAIGYLNDRDWAPVVRVQGHDVNRAVVRDREAALRFIASEQIDLITSMERAQRIDPNESAALVGELEDVVDEMNAVAVSGLVDATLTHAYAVANDVTPDVDTGEQLLAARVGLTDRRLRWIRIAWQPPTQTQDVDVVQPAQRPNAGQMSAIGQHVRADSEAASSPALVADRYRAAGWHVTTGTRWLPAQGPVNGLDPEIVDAARHASIGPLDPVSGPGWVTVADVIDLEEPDPFAASALLSNAINEGVTDAALGAWAVEQAEREAVTAHMLRRWESEPTTQSRAAEVAIGPADPEGPTGPWVELVHLVVADLPPDRIPPGSGSDADRLIVSLRSLDPITREENFRELVAAASSGDRSGELGFFVKEQLDPALGSAAFAPEVTTDAVIGPIKTDLGDELYLVASRFAGALDDRAIGALLEVRGGASATDVAARVSPGNAGIALGGPWRVVYEFPPDSAAKHAIFDTPLDVWSDPFTISGQIAVARVLERRDAPPELDAVARLRVGGFEAWLSGQRAAASITYADGQTQPASASPRAGGVPTLLPQGTPRLPIAPPQVKPS